MSTLTIMSAINMIKNRDPKVMDLAKKMKCNFEVCKNTKWFIQAVMDEVSNNATVKASS
jgi:hypothetical protein